MRICVLFIYFPAYKRLAVTAAYKERRLLGQLKSRKAQRLFIQAVPRRATMVAEIRLQLNGPYHVDFMEPSGPRLRANRRKQEILLSLLREAREQKGLRQADVAAALKCPQTRVSKYELGTRRLDLLELRDVCIVLGVSLVDFVGTFDVSVGAIEAGERKQQGAGRARRTP